MPSNINVISSHSLGRQIIFNISFCFRLPIKMRNIHTLNLLSSLDRFFFIIKRFIFDLLFKRTTNRSVDSIGHKDNIFDIINHPKESFCLTTDYFLPVLPIFLDGKIGKFPSV